MSSVSYINDDLTLRRIAAAASSSVAAERYIAMLEELGYNPQLKDLDLASFSKTFSNLKNIQKLGVEDANYILNLKQYDTEGAGITGTDSFYISAFDNEGSYVDQAFGWSDLTGGFNSVDSYINPFDYSVIKTLDDFYAKNNLDGKSIDQKVAALYNYVITNFSYVQENKDDWNFAGETVFQRGGDCEDLSILMASLGMALMINEGVSYEEANSRFAVVAGRDAKYGDHVYIDYTAEDGTKYVMDTATATQGNIGNVNELLRSAENTSFEVYFRFNDNQILKEPLQVSENKSYIDPNDSAIQKIVGNLKAQGLINEKMSAQEIALTIFRYFQDNFSYAQGQTTSINYGLSASVGILNDETFSYMMMSTVLGALKEVGFDTQTIAQDMYVGFFKNEKEGTTGYAFVYEGRVFDISNKLTTDRKVSNLKDVPLLNSLEVEELQRFDLNNNVYQRSISRFNPKYGSALGSAIGTGSKNYITADMVSGLKKDPLSALGGTPKWGYMTGGLWPGKSTSQITSGLVSKYSALQNHFNEVNLAPVQGPIAGNSFSQNIKAGVTSAVANMADFKRYVKEKNGFWYFDEAAYNKNYTTLNYYQNIVSLMSIVAESKIQAYNNVVSELFDGEGYKSINSASLIKNENDALTKGSSAMRDDLKNMISSHNEQLKTMAEKYLNADLTKRIEQASVTTIMATAIAGTVGFLGADTVATALYYAGLPLLLTPAAPAGAAMIAAAGVLKLIGGKGFDWFAKATAMLISIQKLETEWIKYFNAQKKEDFSEGSESAAKKTTASSIVSANYFADYKNVENGSYESGAVAGLYKGLTELSAIGFGNSRGFAYENEAAVNDKLTELRRSALYLKARNKILEEKKKSYSIVHQELTGKGGYSSSALAEEGINREIEQIEQFAAKIIENRKSYISQQNAREKATKEKDLQMKKSTVMTVAFVTGLILDMTVPVSCSGYVMALANYANTVLEYNTDTNYNPPSLNFTGSYSKSSEWDGVNAALYSSAISYGGKDSPSKLLSNKRFVAGSLLTGGLTLGAGALYDGFNSLMGYRAYGYVNRDRFDIARRAVVTQATLRRMMFIVDHYRKEARNIVRQELSSMTSYTQSSMAEEAISKEAQYQLEVLGAMQSRQEYKQQYENEKTSKKNNFMKQQTTILLGTAAGLLGLIPMVGLLIGFPVFILSTTSSLLYNSMNPNAEEKLNEQHEYDQYITSQKNTSGLVDKETWFVNSATVGAQTQRIMERGTVDYVVYGAYGKKTYLDLTGLQILGSLSNSKSEARAMVHQELTSIGGASSSSSAKASLQSESQLASIAATNFTKIVNDVVQMRQRKADAEYAKKWDKAKAIVLISYYAIMMAFKLPWDLPWTPFDTLKTQISLAAYAAFVFAFSNFLTMAFDLVKGISEWYAASKDDVASKIETARIHNLKRATAAATEKNKGVNAMGSAEDAQADLLMGDSASDMLVDPSNPASIMAAQVRFKQIEKVKEAILKVSRATRSARAMIKAKTTGIVGGTGSSLAETIVKLNSDIADMLLGIMISTAQAKENYERANRNTWGRAAEVLLQAVQLANEGISLGMDIKSGKLSVEAMQIASGSRTGLNKKGGKRKAGEKELTFDEIDKNLDAAKSKFDKVREAIDNNGEGVTSEAQWSDFDSAEKDLNKWSDIKKGVNENTQNGLERMLGSEYSKIASSKVGTIGAIAFVALKVLATIVTGNAITMALPTLNPTGKSEKSDDKGGVKVEADKKSQYGLSANTQMDDNKMSEAQIKVAKNTNENRETEFSAITGAGANETDNKFLGFRRLLLTFQKDLDVRNKTIADLEASGKDPDLVKKLKGDRRAVEITYLKEVEKFNKFIGNNKAEYNSYLARERREIRKQRGDVNAFDRETEMLKKGISLHASDKASDLKVKVRIEAHGKQKGSIMNKYLYTGDLAGFEKASGTQDNSKDKSGKTWGAKNRGSGVKYGAESKGDSADGDRPWDIASLVQNTLLLTAMIIRDKWLAEEEMKEEEKRLNEKLNYVAQLLASGGASMADTALMITADAQTQINAIADRQVADKEEMYFQGLKTAGGVNSEWYSPVTADRFKGSLIAIGSQVYRKFNSSPVEEAVRGAMQKSVAEQKKIMAEKLKQAYPQASNKQIDKFVDDYYKMIEDEVVAKVEEARKSENKKTDAIGILTDVVKSYAEKGKVTVVEKEVPAAQGIHKTTTEGYIQTSLAYTFGDDPKERISVEIAKKPIHDEAGLKTITASPKTIVLFSNNPADNPKGTILNMMGAKIQNGKLVSVQRGNTIAQEVSLSKKTVNIINEAENPKIIYDKGVLILDKLTREELDNFFEKNTRIPEEDKKKINQLFQESQSTKKIITVDGKDYQNFVLQSKGEKAVAQVKKLLEDNNDGVAIQIGSKSYIFTKDGDDLAAQEIAEYKGIEGQGHIIKNDVNSMDILRNNPFKETRAGEYQCKPNGAVRFNLSRIVSDFKNDNNRTAISIDMNGERYTLTKDSKGEMLVKDGAGQNLGTPLIQSDESALLTKASKLDVDIKADKLDINSGEIKKDDPTISSVTINRKDPYEVYSENVSLLVLVRNRAQVMMDIKADYEKTASGEKYIIENRPLQIDQSTDIEDIRKYGIDDERLALWEDHYNGGGDLKGAKAEYDKSLKGKSNDARAKAKAKLEKEIEDSVNNDKNLTDKEKKQFIESEKKYYIDGIDTAQTRENSKNNISYLRQQLYILENGDSENASKYSKDQLAKIEEQAKKRNIPFASYEGKIYTPKGYVVTEKNEIKEDSKRQINIVLEGEDLPIYIVKKDKDAGAATVKLSSVIDDKKKNDFISELNGWDEQEKIVESREEMLVKKYAPQLLALQKADPDFIQGTIRDAYACYMGGAGLDSGIEGTINILNAILENPLALDPQMFVSAGETAEIKVEKDSLKGKNVLIVDVGGKKLSADSYEKLDSEINKALQKKPRDPKLLAAKAQCKKISTQLKIYQRMLGKFNNLANNIIKGGFETWRDNFLVHTSPDSEVGFMSFGKAFDNAGLEIEKQVRTIQLLKDKKKIEDQIDKELKGEGKQIGLDPANKSEISGFLAKHDIADNGGAISDLISSSANNNIEDLVNKELHNLPKEAKKQIKEQLQSTKLTKKEKQQLILKELALNSEIYSKIYVGESTTSGMDLNSGDLTPANYKELYSSKMTNYLLDKSELKIFNNLDSTEKDILVKAGIIKVDGAKITFLIKDKTELQSKQIKSEIKDKISDIYDDYQSGAMKIKDQIYSLVLSKGEGHGPEFKPLDPGTYIMIINENKDIFKNNNPDILITTPEDLRSAIKYCSKSDKELKFKIPGHDKPIDLNKNSKMDELKIGNKTIESILETYRTIEFIKGGEEIISVDSKNALIDAAKGLDSRIKITINIGPDENHVTKKSFSAGPDLEKELNAYIAEKNIVLSDDTGKGVQTCDKYNNLLDRNDVKNPLSGKKIKDRLDSIPEDRLSDFFDLEPGLASNASRLMFKPNAEKLIKNSDLKPEQKSELLALLKQYPRMKGAKDLSVDGNVFSELMEMQAFADAGFDLAKNESSTGGELRFKTMHNLSYPDEKIDARMILTRQEKMNVDELVNDMLGLSEVKLKAAEKKGNPRKQIPSKKNDAVDLEGLK